MLIIGNSTLRCGFGIIWFLVAHYLPLKNYEMILKGSASNVSYKIDRSILDFGQLIHDKKEEKDFFISNTGKVAFEFSVREELDRLR